jgi:hypothetical protein
MNMITAIIFYIDNYEVVDNELVSPTGAIGATGATGPTFANNPLNQQLSPTGSVDPFIQQFYPTGLSKFSALLNRQVNDELPRIIISRIDTDQLGENLGKTIFLIIDTIPYNDNTVCDDVIEIDTTQIGSVFETTFITYPQIQFVVKGQHETCASCDRAAQSLAQKVSFLIDKFKIETDYLSFFQNLSFYAVARYIISGFLYGKFTVKFLLEKYYKQFLIDLASSHFQRFLEFFNTEPYSTYYKYFLFDLKGPELKCIENIICKDLNKQAKKKCAKAGCLGSSHKCNC